MNPSRGLERYFAPVLYLRWITVRALTALFVAGYCLGRAPVLTRYEQMSIERFAPVGPVMLLDAPVSSAFTIAALSITIVLALLVACGRFTRWTAPLLALGLLWVTSYRNSWGMLFHTENLLTIHLGVVAIGEWSIARERADAETINGWPLRLMSAVTVATYVLAGVAKLRNSGMAWTDGEILRNAIAFDALRKAELGSDYATLGAVMVQHAALFPPLAWATLALELGAPLAFAHRYLRWAWIGTAWSFHFGVQWIMWIGFPYPLSLIAYASMLPVERIWRMPGLSALARRWGLARDFGRPLAPISSLGQTGP